MNENSSILIKNIYYMLTYAFKVLKQSNYEKIESETFEHIYDMFATILSKGVSKQIKQGLYKEYITNTESLSTMKGKLEINQTIKNKIKRSQKLACEYDQLSINNIYNKIIKATMLLLLKQKDIKKEYKILLKKNILFFEQVDDINIKSINWSMLEFKRNNANYKMLLNICFFVIDGLLLTKEKGDTKLQSFLDEQKIHSLFENFVLEYYRQHHSYLRPSAPHINWNISENDQVIRYLPIMKTDIVLKKDDRTLIIDTKFYESSTQTSVYSEKETIHSHNLYQIYTYVKNEDKLNSGKVSGLLLYAKTIENITIDQSYMISGNMISVKNLDLNVEFKIIKNQLDEIIKKI